MRTLFERVTLQALGAVLVGGLVTACGDAGDGRPSQSWTSIQGSDGTAVSDDGSGSDDEATASDAGAEPARAACTEGAQVSCRVALPTQGNVENCFVGVQTCVGGVWSACHDPSAPAVQN